MGNLIPVGEKTIRETPVYLDQPLATQVIQKQEQLKTNLQKAINDSRNILNIDANPSATIRNITIPNTTKPVEGFINSNPISDYYTPPFYLANTNTPEVKDYVDAYNKSVGLLDDPNLLNQAQFDTYIHLQNKKLNELRDALKTFPTNGNLNNPVKAIKNLKTSASLNVEEYPDPTNKNNNQPASYKGNGATVYPNYLIYGNNGCLQYNKAPNANTSATWAFKPCNSNLPDQRFTMTKVQNKEDYNKKITEPNNKNYQIQDTNTVIFGFNSVNPETDPNQCLTLNNDGLSVMPCTMEPSQRFKQFYHSITP